MKYILILCLIFNFFGCSDKDVKLSYKRINEKSINCETAFVVSDMDNILLLSHEINSVVFKQHAVYKSKNNNDAFFDCQRKNIVTTYSNQDSQDGISFIDIASGERANYIIADGVNAQVGIFGDSLLLSTKYMHSAKVTGELGFIPRAEIIEGGKRTFEYIHLFNLETRKIIKSYEQNINPYGHIINGKLYGEFIDSIGSVNLKTGFVEKILERNIINIDSNILQSNWPANTRGVFVGDNYYIILLDDSWDVSTKSKGRELQRYEKNGIYKVVNEKLVKIFDIPLENIGYVLSIKNSIFVFDKFIGEISEFNVKTKKITTRIYQYPFVANKYIVNSVGYTDSNFIITLTSSMNGGAIFLVDRFSVAVSRPYKVPLMGMSITTKNDIQTTYYRSID